jgi:hypothetical protein
MQFSTRLLKRSESKHEGSRMEHARLVPSFADVGRAMHLLILYATRPPCGQ